MYSPPMSPSEESYAQLSLLGEAGKADGMERVWEFADPEWKAEAFLCLCRVARVNRLFTTDDIWDLLDPTGATTRDNRAMGPLMNKAAALGLAAKAGGEVPTKRPSAHRRPIPIWRSLICRSGA